MKPLDANSVPLRGSTLIEASAGTGKTYTIATLFVRLLLEQRLAVSQILVVTYTRAATAELRDRIRRRLLEAVAAAGGARVDDALDALFEGRRSADAQAGDRAWLLQALRDFDQAAIFTIHAFCQHTLAECAFESRSPFELLLGENQTPLLREIALDYWARCVYRGEPALVAELREKKVDPEKLAQLAAKVVRDPHMPVLPAGGAELAAPALSLRRGLVDYARAEVARRRRELGTHSFDDLLHQLGAALDAEGGPALARRLRERYPAALIDEFQDTDPVQYGIFRTIYAASGTLFLIGDPKQAIYGFRGADVFAYMQAARLAGSAVYTLGINHRSDPLLVRAVSALFGRARRPFLFDEIAFEEVQPRSGVRDRLAPSGPALQLLFVPRDQRVEVHNGRINKRWGDTQLPRHVAGEIVHLLHSGARIDDEPLRPRHIAVLCRTNAQAKHTQSALSELGVPTALEGDSSVLDTDTAEELSRVLWAIAEPADPRKLGAALATAILGVSGAELHRMQRDDAALEPWLDRFARWNQVWHERGFVQTMHRVLDDADVQPRLLARTDGERKLTDLLHLIEILHEACVQQHLGPLSLLHWFAQMRSDPEARVGVVADAEQMRLEHDEHAVRLTTVHRSKGLEFPIVFCPFMWTSPAVKAEDVRFHDRDDEDRLKLDLGSPQCAAHHRLAVREELAESLRLLYVALTRAKHRCYAAWGRFYRAGASPLGYLLHPDPDAREPGDVERRLSKLSDAQLRAELQALCDASQGSIGVRDLRFDVPARYEAAEQAPGALAARSHAREHAPWPRMTSFSRLTAAASDATAAAHAHAAESPDHDEDVPEPVTDASIPAEAGSAKVALHTFPSGSRPGSLIHAVYEHIDFQRADPAELEAEVDRQLALFGVDAALHRAALVRGLQLSLATPLDGGQPPLTLSRIARAARVDELEFTLAAAARPRAMLAERLADAFAACGAPACDPDYAQRLRGLGSVPPAAFVKGFMDLVFRHEGRYYVADYKSNWLGEHAADYAQPQLVRSMREHHYFLQYHLYVLALHRHLSLRVPNYDYERDFGGVYYLYVRGMSPDHPAGTGVFFDRPPLALIEALASALGGGGAGQVAR